MKPTNYPDCHLVDVGAADDDVGVVDDHHLGVHVDGKPEALAENFGHRLIGRLEAVKVFAGIFSLARAHEQEPVGWVCVAPGVKDGLPHAGVHHLDRPGLPVQDLLQEQSPYVSW